MKNQEIQNSGISRVKLLVIIILMSVFGMLKNGDSLSTFNHNSVFNFRLNINNETYMNKLHLHTFSSLIKASKCIFYNFFRVSSLEFLTKHGKEHCKIDGSRRTIHHLVQIIICWILAWNIYFFISYFDKHLNIPYKKGERRQVDLQRLIYI